MTQIITDLSKLNEAAKPLTFLTETGVEKEEGLSIIAALKETMEADKTILALAAPQIGIDARIFCIRFNDNIKTFINPIVVKKANPVIKPETFVSMPGKEILITRPEELTVVYYTDEFKYEENKLLGPAARLFDQHCQLLDGVTPEFLGLVSDVKTDGSLADLTEEEIEKVIEMYKQYVSFKTKAAQAEIKEDPELEKEYRSLQFTEKVINGKAAIVAPDKDPETTKKAQSIAAMSLKNMQQQDKAIRRAELNNFLRKKGK